jgi:hypothetical protein
MESELHPLTCRHQSSQVPPHPIQGQGNDETAVALQVACGGKRRRVERMTKERGRTEALAEEEREASCFGPAERPDS